MARIKTEPTPEQIELKKLAALEANRKYREKHREKVKAINRANYVNNCETIKAKRRARYNESKPPIIDTVLGSIGSLNQAELDILKTAVNNLAT